MRGEHFWKTVSPPVLCILVLFPKGKPYPPRAGAVLPLAYHRHLSRRLLRPEVCSVDSLVTPITMNLVWSGSRPSLRNTC